MLSVSQIGVGYWGPNLLRNLTRNARCKVHSVAELSEERRQFIRKNYPGLPIVNSVEAVLGDLSVNAVVVATPAETHFELVIKFLNAGKHVLVEKPMAMSVAEVDEIAVLARKKGLVAMVGHTFLYNPAVRYIKKLIDSGELGDVRYIFSQRLNLGRIRSDIDALWNFAPHDISIIQYWLGDPHILSVQSQGMDYVQDGIDDVTFLNIVYPNKIMANIHVSWLSPERVRKMSIVGSKKMAVYDDVLEDKVMLYDKGIDPMAVLGEGMVYDKSYRRDMFEMRSGDVLIPKIPNTEPLQVEIDHFLDCIEKQVPCLTGPQHAREVIRILEQAGVKLSSSNRA